VTKRVKRELIYLTRRNQSLTLHLTLTGLWLTGIFLKGTPPQKCSQAAVPLWESDYRLKDYLTISIFLLKESFRASGRVSDSISN
jgi:hypothetical protein